MSRIGEQSWLLLTVRSLTQNRGPKHYQLLIKNHAIDNKLTIENEFSHNYQYVYKLWPCKPAERELIKIEMFQFITEAGRDLLVKRGQASPLVQYSSEGQKFQFYASNEEKAVLILKFKAENEDKIQNQTSKDRLNIINKDMSRDLQNNQYQSKKYSQFLDYTNRVVNDLDQEQTEREEANSKQKNKLAEQELAPSRSISQIYASNIQLPENGKNRFRSKDKDNNNRDQFLNNSKYLNKSIEVPMNRQENGPNYQRSGRVKAEASNSLQNLGETIKKRRQLYLCNKIEIIAQKPSESPILSMYKSDEGSQTLKKQSVTDPIENNRKENESLTSRPEIKNVAKERVRSQCYSTPPSFKPVESIIQSKLERRSQKSQLGEQSQSLGVEDEVVRTSHFPADYLSLSRRFGTIRRKKLEQADSSQDLMEKVKKASKQRSITHISRNSKGVPTKERYYDIQMFNFRASLYKSKGKCFRKLVLVFEDSRYATENVQCLHLMVEWNQKFGIRNCKQSSYLYCRLYCTIQDEETQEGEATINIEELVHFSSNKYKVFFRSDQLAIGFLEFEYTRNDCTALLTQEQFKELKVSSLPKIKKDSLPKGIAPKKTPLQLEMRKVTRIVSNAKESNLSNSKEKKRYLELKQIDKRPLGMEKRGSRGGKSEVGGLSKIQEKKMKLKSKIK